MHVGSLRCRRQIADRHVLDHAATQRAHLGHRVLLSVDRASTTTILSDGRPSPRRPPYLPRKRVSSINLAHRWPAGTFLYGLGHEDPLPGRRLKVSCGARRAVLAAKAERPLFLE